MEIVENIEMITALVTGLCGLIGTAISTYFAVKNWVKNLKSKSSQEIWGLIMDVADKAMEDPCKPGNPREVSKEDFINLYRAAM